MSDIPSSGAAWVEPTTADVVQPFSRLRPYKTSAGYWVFVPFGSEPASSTLGSFIPISGGSYLALQTPVTEGYRHTKAGSGDVFTYAAPHLFRYAVGDVLTSATFSRASTAEYTQESSTPLFSYTVGGALAAATFTRASTANYVGEV